MAAIPSEIGFVATVLLSLAGLGAAAYLVTIFNNLVQLANNIGKAWGNIDVLVLQRNEELGKLVELTRAYVRHESASLDTLTRLRTRYQSAAKTEQKARIENALTAELHGLRHVWEAYADLKANEMFRQLQTRISAIEDAIADRRSFFNETVKLYNVERGCFPQLVFARALGFRPHPYLGLPTEARS